MLEPRPVAEIRADLRKNDIERRGLRRELARALEVPGAGASRWHGEALEALRADYEGTVSKLRVLALRHKTSAGCICNLADRHGWVRRAVYEQRLHAVALRHASAGVAAP